jgi:hypothetical protein
MVRIKGVSGANVGYLDEKNLEIGYYLLIAILLFSW